MILPLLGQPRVVEAGEGGDAVFHQRRPGEERGAEAAVEGEVVLEQEQVRAGPRRQRRPQHGAPRRGDALARGGGAAFIPMNDGPPAPVRGVPAREGAGENGCAAGRGDEMDGGQRHAPAVAEPRRGAKLGFAGSVSV